MSLGWWKPAEFEGRDGIVQAFCLIWPERAWPGPGLKLAPLTRANPQSLELLVFETSVLHRVHKSIPLCWFIVNDGYYAGVLLLSFQEKSGFLNNWIDRRSETAPAPY